jgi:hypothetical protein
MKNYQKITQNACFLHHQKITKEVKMTHNRLKACKMVKNCPKCFFLHDQKITKGAKMTNNRLKA